MARIFFKNVSFVFAGNKMSYRFETTWVWVNDDRLFCFFSFLIFRSHSCAWLFSVRDLYSPAAKEQQSHDLRSISPYSLCISLGFVRRGWSCFDCYVAPGSPAANGEIQLESEVNNPVWEKMREFQREKERGKPIWALHGERMEKKDGKRKWDCERPPNRSSAEVHNAESEYR